MYKLLKDSIDKRIYGALKNNGDGTTISFCFNPENTDYQRFKKEVLAGDEELQDADGNVMTQEQANEYIANLP
jgi:hypothetical protein